MSSANTTPKFFTPPQIPSMQRRTTITPSRPSTSSGETIEPKSDFLRDALREKKGLPPRSQSTTPRRTKAGARAQQNQIAHDEFFLPSSDDEAKFSVRRNPFRPHQRTRRASEDINSAKASPSSHVRNIGLREADAQMDKLLKENWDLKHRITLHDQAYSKMRLELDAALEEIERSASLRDRNRELEEAIVLISKQAASTEEEFKTLKVNNAELTMLNDDLVRELEQKDDGIQQRQVAIEEAAGIIQTLEASLESLKKKGQDSPRTDSDYFSGDAESTPSIKNSTRPTTAGTCGTEYANPPDSDYFSADNSPTLTPTKPKTTPSKEHKDKSVQIERARAMGASFNREVGLRSQASRDSLLSTFLETPVPEPSKYTARALQRKAPRVGQPVSPPRGSIREDLLRTGTPAWTDARELRTIYEDGGLYTRIGSTPSIQHTGYTPSVTVASVSTAPSIDDIFGLNASHHSYNNHNMSSFATAVSSTTSPAAPKASNPSKLQPPLQQQIPANPTPVNYNVWPRQLPEWPPSAGLRNRDVLFHGTGMEEMFPDSPPRPSSSRESFSNVHLLRSGSGWDRHGRSSSAAPAAKAVAPPPPLTDGSFTHRPSASMSVPRRPVALERSRTLPLQ